MKFWVLLFTVSLAAYNAAAQVELVSANDFPADLEFRELRSVVSDESISDASGLSKVEDGPLFSDVGFEKYERRVYAAGAGASLSIEVVTLKDARAAYSLLTLLRPSTLRSGPPGDAFTADAGTL